MDIHFDEDKILNSFLSILSIPSHSQQEANVASFIKEWCRAHSIDVLEDDTKEQTGSNTGNLICTIKGTNKDMSPVFFTAHMDTIETEPVYPYVENGYVKTDGTTALGADDKAGIIALLKGMEYIIESSVSYGDIQLIFTVCEEQGLIGARALDKNLIKGDFGYTVDADEPVGTCITRSPAIEIVTISVTDLSNIKGNRVHDAVSNIIRLIAKYPVKKELHVSIIGFQENKQLKNGGIDLTIKLKSINEDYLQSYIYQLKNFTQKSVQSTELVYTINTEKICNSYQYDLTDVVLSSASRAAKLLDVSLIHKERLDVSDANVFTGEQTPTMTIGVGYEHIHTKKERMSIAQLFDLTRFIIGIVFSMKVE